MLTSVLAYINDRADYGYFVERSEVASPWEKRVITLIRRYGEKLSLFVKSYTTPLFELMNIELRSNSKENSVTIEV